jgi:hypothetical protein
MSEVRQNRRATTYATRTQLSTDEKVMMTERIKKMMPDESEKNLIRLMHEWNSDNPNRLINLTHLRRIRDSIPDNSSAEEFWDSVKSKVESELLTGNLKVTGEQFETVSKMDKNGRETKVLDSKKIPFITDAQSESLKFDFQKEAYCRPGEDGRFIQSTKLLKDHFRNHLYAKGIVLAPFGSFMNREEQETLTSLVGNSSQWRPSETEGVWKRISEAVVENKFKEGILEILHPAFSDEEKREDRLNPNYSILREVAQKLGKSDVLADLSKV